MSSLHGRNVHKASIRRMNANRYARNSLWARVLSIFGL